MATPLALIWDMIAVDNATGVFKKVGAEAKGVAAETSTMGATFTKMGGLVALAGVGIAAVGVKMAVEFQESTAKIQGNAQITAKAAKGIGDAFLATAGKSTFSGKEMADAFGPVSGVIQTLAGHTLNAADASKVMAAATTLAEASGNPLKNTTADLAAVMQSYGIDVRGAADASNILFNASRLTNIPLDTLTTTVDKLHGKLGIAAPDLMDVSALLVDLANHGIQGSKGVLIVNSGLNTLLGGSKATSAELKDLGVKLFDANGKFVGLDATLKQLTPKLKGMSDQQRLAALSTLFGKSAAKALDSTIRDGVGGLDKARLAVGKHDAAQKAAEIQAKTFAGQMKILKATFVDLEIEIGNKVIPVIMKVIGFFETHSTAAKALGIVVGGILVAAFAAWAVQLAIVVGEFLILAAPVIATVAAFVAVGAAVKYAYDHFKIFHDIVNTVFNFIKDHWQLLLALITGPIGQAVILVIKHWNDIKTATINTFNAVKSAVTTSVNAVKSAVTTAFNAVKSVVTGSVNAVKSAVTGAFGAAKSAVTGAMSAIKTAVSSGISKVIADFKAAPGKITSALGKLGGLLLSAGEDLIKGLIQGIGNMAKAAADAAKHVVSGAVSGAKHLLGIHSPSTVFAEIGKFVGQGFIDGVNGTRDDVKATFEKLGKLAADTHNAGIERLVEGAKLRLLKLSDAYDATVLKIKAAVDKLTALYDAAASLRASVSGSVVSTGDISGLGGTDVPVTFDAIIAKLTDAKTQAASFATVMAQLKTAGLDQTTISQLIAAGPASLAAAQQILASGATGIQQIKDLQAGIAKAATSLGKTAADSLYAAGIAAAKGLVHGLQSQEAALVKEMTHMGQVMAAALKKALDSHSPSRVFAAIGADVGRGVIHGVDGSLSDVVASSGRMAAALIAPHKSTKFDVSAIGTVPAGRMDTAALDRREPQQIELIRAGVLNDSFQGVVRTRSNRMVER